MKFSKSLLIKSSLILAGGGTITGVTYSQISKGPSNVATATNTPVAPQPQIVASSTPQKSPIIKASPIPTTPTQIQPSSIVRPSTTQESSLKSPQILLQEAKDELAIASDALDNAKKTKFSSN